MNFGIFRILYPNTIILIFRPSLSNYFVRNAFAYIVVMATVMLVIVADTKAITAKSFFLNYAYYTLVFCLVFFHNRILLLKLLFKGKIGYYLISLTAAYFLFYTAGKFLADTLGYPISHARQLFFFIGDMALGISIYLSTKYFLERKQFYQTNLMKRDIELQQLKSQLNPHFLFNALNNIYSYNLDNNKHGNDLILRLSQLMRFIVESRDKQIVTVEEEMEFIENYIAFEKERLGQRCEINYCKKLNDPGKHIAPLLFFPFVENAFKHGTNRIANSVVDISLTDEGGRLSLIVKNSIGKNTSQSTRTGLPNVSRRLELLYPEKHQLKISNSDKLFIIELTLNHA